MKIAIIGAGSVGAKARSTTVAEAGALGEVVVLATPWEATQSAIGAAGGLAGKIVVDCTNPLANRDGELGLAVGFDGSGGEQVAAWAPKAHVFKALNQVGYLAMEDAKFPDGFPAMFVAGPLKVSRLLEPYAMLWIHLAYNQGLGRDFAFSLLRR